MTAKRNATPGRGETLMSDKLDSLAFKNMLHSAEPDKTAANLFSQSKKPSTEDLHNTLMLAGFTPGYGNIADIADAILYAAEGEFGEAALSGASVIPIVGQMIAGKRALRIAKEAGEEIVTLYRGVEDWVPGKMVKEGKFVGGGKWVGKGPAYTKSEKGLFTTKNKDMAEVNFNNPGGAGINKVLEFEVPKSYLNTKGQKGWFSDDVLFERGLPKEFLKKVHKIND